MPAIRKPLWRRPLFALGLAGTFLGGAAACLYGAMFHSWDKVHPPGQFRLNTTAAVLFLVLAMVLVIAAIAVPVVLGQGRGGRGRLPQGKNA